ncbi:ATP-dependent RNA helicase, putative [Eimeria tenella]|uniref:ATP-dependent RNA helicase, putative n=1 Tax=Eimeria tenella TaxID=5802 RepID=U6L3W6_EIMTE|nr:ATP-dependent RNA helicase, putative [Eimeria tenella]CDJ43898.1 ATP-dependent RNA helicase, putative [Eimeria tenella]|eukprot:XP_013234647.1 ATP-dependent RNA helicase, putative [Eimeria tenella]
MTGQDDIEVCCILLAARVEQLGPRAPPLTLLPIYSQLGAEQQAKVFAASAFRKVIVATNIAETSLTLEGVKYVVDCGLCKVKVFSAAVGMDLLQLAPISQAAALQRSGRAGRCSSGCCFRLYPEAAFLREMLPAAVPEVQRSNLSNVVLLLKSLGVSDLENFDLIDPPPRDCLLEALHQLWALGALDAGGALTAAGQQMAAFPLDPPLSKMLLAAAAAGGSSEIVSVVSLLSVPSLFFPNKEKQQEAEALREKFFVPDSDHLTLLNVFQQFKRANSSPQWCLKHFVQPKAMARVQEVRAQLVDTMRQHGIPEVSCGTDWDILRKAICAGYFHQAAKLRGIGEYLNLRTCVPCHVHPNSALYAAGQTPEYVVYHQLLLTTKEYMRTVTAVDAHWLAELGPMFYTLRKNLRPRCSKLQRRKSGSSKQQQQQQQQQQKPASQKQQQDAAGGPPQHLCLCLFPCLFRKKQKTK